jgi:hypothetical protein
MHTMCSKLSPHHLLEVLDFKTVISKGSLYDWCVSDFGVRNAQTLFWKSFAFKLNK